MRILKNFEVLKTTNQRYSDFDRSFVLDLSVQDTGNIKPAGFQPLEEYVLFAKIGVTFWANKIMYADAAVSAEKTLLSRLYQDQLVGLTELRHAVMNGDAKKCLQIIDMMRDEMGVKS